MAETPLSNTTELALAHHLKKNDGSAEALKTFAAERLSHHKNRLRDDLFAISKAYEPSPIWRRAARIASLGIVRKFSPEFSFFTDISLEAVEKDGRVVEVAKTFEFQRFKTGHLKAAVRGVTSEPSGIDEAVPYVSSRSLVEYDLIVPRSLDSVVEAKLYVHEPSRTVDVAESAHPSWDESHALLQSIIAAKQTMDAAAQGDACMSSATIAAVTSDGN